MFVRSKLLFNAKFNPLFRNTSFFNFQNKIILSKENFSLLNTPSYNKVSLKSTPENPIKEKTFYFGIIKIN
jgi:hypothetical protein